MTHTHDGGSTYSDEENQEIAHQTNILLRFWNRLSEEIHDSNTARGIHPPPALLNHYDSILTTNNPLKPVVGIAPKAETVIEALGNALEEVIAYGDMMFRFGQYCSANGLKYDLLIPCKCDEVGIEQAVDRILKEGR